MTINFRRGTLATAGAIASSSVRARAGDGRIGWYQLGDELSVAEANANAPLVDLVVVTPWFLDSLARVKAANPACKVLAYHNIYVTVNDGFQYDSNNDPGNGNFGDWALPFSGGMGYGWANTNQPSWFSLNSSGVRYEFTDYPGRWVMRAGLTAYQNQWAANVIGWSVQHGFDGVFLDDALPGIAHGMEQSTEYNTDAKVKTATASFMTNVGGQLKAQGLICVPNVAGIALFGGLWAEWDQLGSGMFEEKFMFWDNVPTNWQGADTSKYMAQGVPHPDFNVRKPRQIFNVVNTYGNAGVADTLVNVAYALYLCYNDGGAVFVCSAGPDNYFGPPYITTEMSWNLGAQTVARSEITTYTFLRKFSKGAVAVRIDDTGGTVNVPLGGTYYDRTGASFTEVNLGNKSAKILKTNSGTGAP